MQHAPVVTASAIRPYRFPLEVPDDALPAREIVGSKALNLMKMARAGLPVPPGFVLGTDLCRAYMEHGAPALVGLKSVVGAELRALEERTGRRLGDGKRPLLVSVRSGAAVSMPGMMETVLNVGLTTETLPGLLRQTGNPRLVQDCLRRLVAQFGEVVHAVPAAAFEGIVAAELAAQNLSQDHELDTRSLRLIAERSKDAFEHATGDEFSDDPMAQLMASIEAVLKSWNTERAKTYRRLNAIADSAGTATIVQMMVFGNAGPTSGSGVGFTRNPADGSNALYCDYLQNAQGEDVVSGRRSALGADDLQRRVPDAHRDLTALKDVLERTFSDMQDFEFTVENRQLYLLQARNGKRTPLAALRIAYDLVKEGVITPQEAMDRLRGIAIDDIKIEKLVVRKGLAPIASATTAGSGVAVGVAVMDPLRVGDFAKNGKRVILLCQRLETSEIDAVAASAAIVTAVGARTSHAAVIARQLGKVCLVGCKGLRIDESRRGGWLGEKRLTEGDAISVDGNSGLIYPGEAQVRASRPTALVEEIRTWQAGGVTK